jgi:hypothetical protein
MYCREHLMPPDPDDPCPGRSCTFSRSCPNHDDCFLRRRALGWPDSEWDEERCGPEPGMSKHVDWGLEWLTTPEGQEWVEGFLANRTVGEPWIAQESVVVCVEIDGEELQVWAIVLEDQQSTVLVAVDAQPITVEREQVFGRFRHEN